MISKSLLLLIIVCCSAFLAAAMFVMGIIPIKPELVEYQWMFKLFNIICGLAMLRVIFELIKIYRQ